LEQLLLLGVAFQTSFGPIETTGFDEGKDRARVPCVGVLLSRPVASLAPPKTKGCLGFLHYFPMGIVSLKPREGLLMTTLTNL
jgi:hypothetical protein